MVSVIQSKTSSLEIDCGGIQLKGVALKQKHRKRAKKRKEVVFTILLFVKFLYIYIYKTICHHNLCCWLESSSLKIYSELWDYGIVDDYVIPVFSFFLVKITNGNTF